LSQSAEQAAAQAERDAADQDPLAEQQRQETREQMAARWTRLRALVRAGDQQREIERVAEPIFTYSESTRESGHLGTMWVWGTTGRPVALLAQNKAYGEPLWGFELVALAEGVSVEMHDGWTWSPKSAVQMKPLKDAPVAAESKIKRLTQLKGLAERFTLTEQYFDESFVLRLLPRPVYRYQDDEAGLIDGALFNFAHGTNPEIFAVIECRKEASGSVWSYGFLPLAGAGVTAQLDGTTVWTKEPTRESKAQELYSTWLETVKK
jgi:hypothetical protein